MQMSGMSTVLSGKLFITLMWQRQQLEETTTVLGDAGGGDKTGRTAEGIRPGSHLWGEVERQTS